MLRSMFGMGGTEILVILIVALLFLGPDKLPEAAKQISKGIRDIKKQSRVLQRTIEEDENIGGAIRDLKSALRGEDEPIRPRPPKPAKQLVEAAPQTAAATAATIGAALPEPGTPGTPEHGAGPDAPPVDPQLVSVLAGSVEPKIHGGLGDHPAASSTGAETNAASAEARPALTMPPTAGEPDEEVPATSTASDDAELAAMVKPAAHTIPHQPAPAPAIDQSSQSSQSSQGSQPSHANSPDQPDQSEPKHG